eukprot:TRINITY_DN10920_c0_g1_i3.p1 TRINITY_DN10920_c0_g1~~TRINITY_DN10920_c0_g1_i3.p1  ORF type:complete len:191 (+),score=25.95 TRINITY_DN10920_c0_g1_i3:144-716(+)
MCIRDRVSTQSTGSCFSRMPQGADGSCPGPMKAAVLLLLLCITALSVVVLSTSPALSSELPDQRFSLSISPLNNHISALVPGRGLQDGTAMPVALNRSMTEHQFATFCAAGAVNLSAFRMTVQRLEERILTETAPRRGLYELVADSDGEHRPRLTSRSDRCVLCCARSCPVLCSALHGAHMPCLVAPLIK